MKTYTKETGTLRCSGEETEQTWKRAALWLCFLGPFFFLSYGFANWLATQHENVGSLFYSWEHNIPFLSWTIIPYWSIDVLYGLSLFVCCSKSEIDMVGKRLLSAQIIAVLCFIAFPLSFAFVRPETSHLTGILFDMLDGFDQPFNQAPSLHIALLVILWTVYAKHVPKRWNRLLHTWFAMIGLSVLTTYQHHFIDVPTGALLGLFCVWLWPEKESSPLSGFRLTQDRRCFRLALIYIGGGAFLAAIAYLAGGAFLWLFWPAVSLFLVALAYAGMGNRVFQKTESGQLGLAVKCLLAPYLIGAWINSRLWTFTNPAPAYIMDNVWIGRFPSEIDVTRRNFESVVDLTNEMSAPRVTCNWQAMPSLDLATPRARLLYEAAQAIEVSAKSGKVLVCCALGYSRSAAAIATWLTMTGRAASAEEAIAMVVKIRPHTVLNTEQHAAISQAGRSLGA